ncbi:MAG: 50S ribosomal protein L31 [Chlamydiae bacterium CG10_big_fil_rev_8_21_14_0_10_35_9]|nr:MAG: 50S ribosomal protein L31 [Chlamydiae bacterium CG10_big_fil_rev_8_21_14_0_10_35_9]
MKDEIHPPYQDVLFIDSSTGAKFLIGSSLQTEERAEFEGKEYPAVKVSISSSSHPFYTGSTQILDTEGRVDKFTKRYKMKKEQQMQDQQKQEEKEAAPKKKVAKSKKK